MRWIPAFTYIQYVSYTVSQFVSSFNLFNLCDVAQNTLLLLQWMQHSSLQAIRQSPMDTTTVCEQLTLSLADPVKALHFAILV